MATESTQNKQKAIWTPCRQCACGCGKLVVLLRGPGFHDPEKGRKWVLCYLKGWDGNPFYVHALPHRRKKFKAYMDTVRAEEVKGRDPDPFFHLE